MSHSPYTDPRLNTVMEMLLVTVMVAVLVWLVSIAIVRVAAEKAAQGCRYYASYPLKDVPINCIKELTK